MKVLDASVALCWVLAEPWSKKAIQLRDEFQQQITDLTAPDIFLGEVAHALTKAERKKQIAVGQGAPLFAQVLATPPILHPYIPLLGRALDISSQTKSALFDCLYVALAEREQCDLVTVDDKLVNKVQQQFPFVKHLSSLP